MLNLWNWVFVSFVSYEINGLLSAGADRETGRSAIRHDVSTPFDPGEGQQVDE